MESSALKCVQPKCDCSAATPMWTFARQILASGEYLAQVEAGLSTLKDKLALVVWGEADGAFRTRIDVVFFSTFQFIVFVFFPVRNNSSKKMHLMKSVRRSWPWHLKA